MLLFCPSNAITSRLDRLAVCTGNAELILQIITALMCDLVTIQLLRIYTMKDI